MVSMYLLARWPDGEPEIRVLGDFRPSNEAIEEAKNLVENNYDRNKAEKTVQEKCDSLPQDREPSDMEGSFVKLGMAEYDKNTGQVSFDERDYTFKWSEDYEGREPDQCSKGHYEDAETFYNTTGGTPERPW